MSPDVPIEPSSDIAIIGYAARLPGATDTTQFWRNLRRGVESIRTFSIGDLESVGVKKSVLQDPDYVCAGAPLQNLDFFDAGFFGINPREAAIMDPQLRLFLETAWEAFEHAGHVPGTFPGQTGVFAGCGPNSYLVENLLTDPGVVEKDGVFFLRHIGNDKDVLAARLSYQLNLRGPSVNVQTACSSSLVAIHLASQSLLNYECDIAVAGAVSLEIPHAIGYRYRQNEILSQDGHCRAFDASATGTVYGSGVGVVILRRLSDAMESGDTIHAVIKGSAVNSDGHRKVGFFAPSVEGQVEVIEAALASAEIDPATVDYVETNGTGTPIGDPIELTALEAAYGDRPNPLKLGSVKTNIGHLDTAAGMAGVLKTVLALGHGEIPPTLHFKALNPLIDAGKTKLQVVDQLTEWPVTDTPRRAGVTALGIGGTNAHLILEEPPEAPSSLVLRRVRLLTLSAKSAEALEASTKALAAYLRHAPAKTLSAVTYTLHVGRTEFAHRRMFLAHDHAEALQLADLPTSSGVVTGKKIDPNSVAFLFSSQGSQYYNMARELYDTEPVFRKWLDLCAEQARTHLGFDFREILYPTRDAITRAAEQIKLTWNAQPILFAVEYALAQLWISWGVLPDKLIGHSLGEYPAACLSGIFTMEDALSLVCAQGRLIKKTGEGAMLAVALPEAEVARWLTDGLSLAAVNSREQCVVSGSVSAITALEARLQKEEVACQRLEISHAFHSSAVDPVLEEYTELVRQVQLSPPLIPIISNVTGTWLTDQDATDPAYWARHFRQTVRYGDGLAVLQSAPGSYLIEIGPGETLACLSRQYAGEDARQRIFPSLPRQSEKNSDLSTILTALGNMWVHGATIDWQAFHAHEKLRRIPLPTYPFQRKSFWVGPKLGTNWLTDSIGKVDNWFYRIVWNSTPLPPPSLSTETWLVLCDSSPDSEKLVAELRGQKMQVVTVTPGTNFQATDETSYEMNLASQSDYGLLFDHLAQRNQVPRHIIHLWGLKPAPDGEDRCFHSLLFLIQTWGARHPGQSVAITAYSHGSVSVHNELVLHPYGSLLAGPCRVAPLEYPTVRCRQIDVDSTEPKTLAEIIRREGGMENEADPADSLAVYRSGNRWAQDVEHFKPEPVTGRLRDSGVYLITGGLGGLGMAVADALARSRHARLVLISRHAETPEAAHAARFAEWRQLGAEVLVIAADVTDRESTARALAQAREKFGPLHGIIHAAGVLHDGIIQLKKKSTAHSVLAPKIEGVQVLDDLTRGQHLDFFALFSSVSAVAPPDGQVDYCAANSFLTAFAQSRPVERNFVVIAWGPWAEIGMVAPKPEILPADQASQETVDPDPSTRTIHPGSKTLTGIATREGLGAFHRIMGSRSPNLVLVSPVSLSPTAPMKASETLAGSVTASDDDIELVLTQLWERLLGLKQVNVNTDFFDSGGHSLLAVRLFTEIRKRFDIDFGLSTLFEARTIRALADLIRKTQKVVPSERNAPAIVSIRTGGSNTPLFLIHDVGGSVLRYEHLARHFPENQSIFAIESRGLSGLPADFSVEDMARHYIEQIRERQPKGPYYVAGHSFGGMVAYEIARQLTAKNETMGLVGLLDTYQRNMTEEDALQQTDVPARIGKLPVFKRLAKDFRTLLLGSDRVRYLLERQTFLQAWVLKTIYRRAYKVTTQLGRPMPRFLNNVKEANWIALDHFTPQPYDGSVVLFQCLDRLDTDFPDSSHVWKRLVGGRVTILGVPGDHNSILREPGVSVLAKQILGFLQTGKPAPADSKSDR